MFAKLAVVILTLFALGGVLLASRHARVQLTSEAAQATLRVAAADDELLGLRAQIAQRVAPEQVMALAASSGVGELRPATDDLPVTLARDGLAPLDEMRAKAWEEVFPPLVPREVPAIERSSPLQHPRDQSPQRGPTPSRPSPSRIARGEPQSGR